VLSCRRLKFDKKIQNCSQQLYPNFSVMCN
jgi:hypothetical protein